MLWKTNTSKDTNTMTISKKEYTSGRTYNRAIDKDIDIKGYLKKAKYANRQAIKNAGIEIKANNSDVYQDTYFICKTALTQKYTKIVNESKTHHNPKKHIYQKYFDSNYSYYELDLDDVERNIAYQYEMQIYNSDKIINVQYKDSLFRDIMIDNTLIDKDKNEFNHQMIYAQIHRIFAIKHIELTEGCTFVVNPYSYYISVNDTPFKLKKRIEKALNVGDNGKNLYRHIKNCAVHNDMTQVTNNGYLKYQAYHQILALTGLKLNELEEKDGTYYTADGIDIYDVMSQAINLSLTIPKPFKKQLKEWINHLLNEIAIKGWHNIPDMYLNMLYEK